MRGAGLCFRSISQIVMMMGMEPDVLKTSIYTHNTLLLCRTKTSPQQLPYMPINLNELREKENFRAREVLSG